MKVKESGDFAKLMKAARGTEEQPPIVTGSAHYKAAAEGGSGLGGAITAAGPAVAAVAVVVTAVAAVVTKIGVAIDTAAKTAAKYNGGVAMASAQAQVAQVQGDIRRSNMNGAELTKFVQAQSRANQNTQDAVAKAIKPLIPLFTKAMENLAPVIEKVGEVAAESTNNFATGLRVIKDWLDGDFKLKKEAERRKKQAVQRKQDAIDAEKLRTEMREMMNSPKAPGIARAALDDGRNAVRRDALNIPAFGDM